VRTQSINKSLEITLSTERLEIYLVEKSTNLDVALTLYEKNTRLSEAFYTPLQCVEVCLRNTIDARLSNVYGADWFLSGKPPFSEDSLRMIEEALEELRKDGQEPSHGQVVAELKFGFWVGLLGPHYDSTLWRKCLYKGFLAKSGKPRKEVHGRFNAIRRFRNRVAHHEPIFNRKFLQMHDEIIEAISWMCKDTSAWALHHSRLPAVAAAEK
jgi:hypothetical protein